MPGSLVGEKYSGNRVSELTHMNQTPSSGSDKSLFSRPSYKESVRIGDILRKETVGGMVLIAGALLALIWANTPLRESPTLHCVISTLAQRC